MKKLTRLHFSTEYGCHALWCLDDAPPTNLPADQLPLSTALVGELAAWEDTFQSTLDGAYPPDSGFATAEEVAPFAAWSERLLLRLRAELPGVEVTGHFFAVGVRGT